MPKFDVERSIEIDASPEQVFDVVSDFKTWTTWSPWLCAEPDAKVTVADDSASVGSTYRWSGEVVGAGEVEHKNLERGRLINEEMRILKPFKSRSEVGFQLESSGDVCRLTWSLHGSMPWFLFWMIPKMQNFIGMDYVRGLKMLKDLIESGSVPSTTISHGIESVGPIRMAGIRTSCNLDDIAQKMQAAFCEVGEKFEAAGIQKGCEGITVHHSCDFKTQTFDCTSGFVLPDSVTSVPDGLSTWSTEQVQALRIEHIGHYKHLGNAWSAAHQIARYRKHKLNTKSASCELYRNEPGSTPPEELRSDVYLPLR